MVAAANDAQAEVWTKVEHFARWFAPDNVRPGGVISR
jgi:hypothetical protein